MRSAAVATLVLYAATTSALAVPVDTKAVDEAKQHGRELTTVRYRGAQGTGSTYGQRTQDSLIGMLAGLALLFIAPMLLVMTEVQGVKITRLIGRARASTLAGIPSATVDPSLDGCMLHTVGPLSVQGDANGVYTDKETGVSFGAGALGSATVNSSHFAFPVRGGAGASVPSCPLKVERTVEVYQWVERKERDHNTTDYVYETRWLAFDVPSANFVRQNHANPTRRLVDIHSSTTERPEACIGAFRLSDGALAKADWWGGANVSPSTSLSPALAAAGARIVQMEAGMGIYVPSGRPPVDNFSIGDMRISYRTVEMPSTPATAVGVQQGNTLRPYTRRDAAQILGDSAPPDEDEINQADARSIQEQLTSLSGERPNCCKVFNTVSSIFAKLLLGVMRHVVGTDVVLLSPLQTSPAGMFWSEQVRVERALTKFRLLGTVLFILAFYLILHPISALFSFIPFLAKLISSLFLVAAVIVGFICSVVTIAGAWLVVKPLRAALGFAILAAAFALEAHLDPLASLSPSVFFGGLAAVASCLAAYECYRDCKFQSAARAGLQGVTYTQVGVPVQPDSAAAGKKVPPTVQGKEMM